MIYFTQTDILLPDFRYRLPSRPRTQPKSTTRTVRGDLDHAQALIQKRGWR